MTDRRNLQSFCDMLYDPPKLTTPAILHGKTYEAVAVTSFEEKYNVKVDKCGLFINPQYCFLGASPGMSFELTVYFLDGKKLYLRKMSIFSKSFYDVTRCFMICIN